ncbi:MAG: HAD-IA family hydrolase [Spirochaetia bacterium]
MIRAVLLDMDGVLVDSEPFILKAATMMFIELGCTVHPADFEPFVGSGENKYLGGVAEQYGITIDIDRAKARTYDIYDEIIAGHLRPLPGVGDFLKRCRGRSLAIAVATSADERKLLANLDAIGLSIERFDTSVNGLEVTHRKPHPEIYLSAAARLAVEPESCLVVEDAVNGIEAARRAGCRCAALTTSFQAQKLTRADWIVDNLAAVPDEALEW